MTSVFTKIIDGKLPGHFVWRDPSAVAFMSINPIRIGHTLVVPRAEVDHWLDLSPQEVAHLMQVSHAVGAAQAAAFSPERVGLIIAGFEVPHVHVHVIPTWDMSDLSFDKAQASVPPEELADAAARLRSALSDLGYEQASD